MEYDSEQLLYRCDPKKYVEVAAASISITNIFNGGWRINRKELRKKQTEGVIPLTVYESLILWSHAFVKAIIRKIILD